MSKPRFKPTALTNAGRTIRKAAQVIEDRGWTQDALLDPLTGAVCARGGIALMKTGNALNMRVSEEEKLFSDWLYVNRLLPEGVLEFLDERRAMGPYTHSVVPSWNDSPTHTKEDVIAYMRKFADEVDPQRP